MKLTRTVSLIALLAVAAAVAAAPADRGQVATGRAVLTSMYGDVQVRHGAGGYHPARLNEVLVPNDGVKTGSSSRAEISVGEGGYVRMDENSQLLITGLDAAGTTSFQALVGGIWVTIEKALGGASKFEVRMPSAVASVTGTVFRCEVGADGTSETYVYEGAVDIQAGETSYQVTPDQRCRVPRGTRTVAVEQFDLSGDDEAAWVMYNRHRDIVRHLGNPGILVGLREHQMPQQGAFFASEAISAQLALHGLHSSSIADVDTDSFTFNPDGSIRWRKKPDADYCVIGDVTLEQIKPLNGIFSARVRGDIRLVHNGESEALTSVGIVVPGVGEDQREAVRNALDSLGRRVGVGMAPRILREMMQEMAGTVRIDISGADRGQASVIKHFVTGIDGVMRTAPLALPGGRVSLAVITSRTPQELGRVLEERAGDAVEVIAAGGRVLYVRFTGPPAPQAERPARPQRPPNAPAPGRNN